MELINKKILLTGGAGFLGKFVLTELKKRGVIENNIFIPRSISCDLREQKHCREIVQGKDIIIHLAAKVGGIEYNKTKPGELFYNNALPGLLLMEEARKVKVQKFVTIGSVCSYPKFTPTPFKESSLWQGFPEETNAPYGLAKSALLIQGQAYHQQYNFNVIHLILVNLFGPGDNFNPQTSHVIPALIKKVFLAKKENKKHIDVWGTGNATREFLYVADAAQGIVMATESYRKSEPINIGSGQEISIKKLIFNICEIMNFKGEIRWDTAKPDGQPRRCLDVSLAIKEFNFKAKTPFKIGLQKTITWYENNISHLNS